MQFQKERINDMLKQADDMATMINVMQHMYDVMQQLRDTTHRIVSQMHDLQAVTEELRDHIADFDVLPAADPQLPLLGAALLQYSHLLVAQSHI